MGAVRRVRAATVHLALAMSRQPVAAVRSPVGLLALAGVAGIASARALRSRADGSAVVVDGLDRDAHDDAGAVVPVGLVVRARVLARQLVDVLAAAFL